MHSIPERVILHRQDGLELNEMFIATVLLVLNGVSVVQTACSGDESSKYQDVVGE